MGLRLGANVLILPLVLRRLTPEEMGVWYVFVAIAALNPILDMGVSTTLMRFASMLWAGAERVESTGLPTAEKAGPNIEGLSRLYSAARVIYLLLAIGIVVLMALAGPLLVFSEKQEMLKGMAFSPVWWAFIAVSAMGVYSQFGNTMLRGIGKIVPSQVIQILANCLYLMVAAGLIVAGAGLYSLIGGACAYSAVVGIASRRLLARANIEGRFSLDRGLALRMVPGTARMAVVCLGNFLMVHSGIVLSARHLSLSDAASLGLSLQLVNAMAAMTAVPVNVRVPRFTQFGVNGDLRGLRESFSSAMWLGAAGFAAGAVVIVGFGADILRLFGSKTTLLSGAALGFLCSYKAVEFVQNNFVTLVASQNRIPFVLQAVVGGGLTYVVGSQLVRPLGLWGLLLATGGVQLVVCSWYPIFLGVRLLRRPVEARVEGG